VSRVVTLTREARINDAPGGHSRVFPPGTRLRVSGPAANPAFLVAISVRTTRDRRWRRLGPFAVVARSSLVRLHSPARRDPATSEADAVALARELARSHGEPRYAFAVTRGLGRRQWRVSFTPPGVYPYVKVHPDGHAVVHARSALDPRRRGRGLCPPRGPHPRRRARRSDPRRLTRAHLIDLLAADLVRSESHFYGPNDLAAAKHRVSHTSSGERDSLRELALSARIRGLITEDQYVAIAGERERIRGSR
jgi:hypothetical protein